MIRTALYREKSYPNSLHTLQNFITVMMPVRRYYDVKRITRSFSLFSENSALRNTVSVKPSFQWPAKVPTSVHHRIGNFA
jgi:hypothetical protein